MPAFLLIFYRLRTAPQHGLPFPVSASTGDLENDHGAKVLGNRMTISSH